MLQKKLPGGEAFFKGYIVFVIMRSKKKKGEKPQPIYRLVYSVLFIEHQPVRVEVVLMRVQQVYVAEIVAVP